MWFHSFIIQFMFWILLSRASSQIENILQFKAEELVHKLIILPKRNAVEAHFLHVTSTAKLEECKFFTPQHKSHDDLTAVELGLSHLGRRGRANFKQLHAWQLACCV